MIMNKIIFYYYFSQDKITNKEKPQSNIISDEMKKRIIDLENKIAIQNDN